MIRCASCGTLNEADDSFCSDCGSALRGPATTTVCATCRSALVPGESFCGECGSRNAEPEPATGAATVAAVSSHTAAPSLRPTPVMFVVAGGHGELASLLSQHGFVLQLTGHDATAEVHQACRQQNCASVCIVGAPWEIPMASVPDPTGKDECVYTDNVYGMDHAPDWSELLNGSSILPEVPVGRIPFTDPQLVARVLAQGSGLMPTWRGGLAVSAAVWKGATDAVLRALAGKQAPPLWPAPPVGEEQLAEAMNSAPGRLYFNVHGTDQEPVWVGDDGKSFPAILRPNRVRVAERGIVISEACYGANLVEGEAAISARFLEAGAGCFVGSTVIAWGPADAPPGLADLIVIGTYRALDEGHSAGEALLQAKRELLDAATRGGEPLSPQAHNTLLSFVLYGSPEARIAGVKSVPAQIPRPSLPGGVDLKGPRGVQSVLERTRARMAGRSPSPLDATRGRLQSNLGVNDWQEISRGRVAFAQLASDFVRGADLQVRIAELLGATPGSIDVLRYAGGDVRRVALTATETSSWGAKHVAMITDADGAVVQEWVSR